MTEEKRSLTPNDSALLANEIDGYLGAVVSITPGARRLLERAAPALRAPSETKLDIPPWIMTADRLPPHGENVLFLTHAGSWLGWLDADNGDGKQWRDHFEDELICTTLDVLCWMPVPKQPEKFTVKKEQLDATER